jgi:omega-amidase
MSILSKSPVFKPFNLALIQLGGIGANKTDNLKHAREMIFRAAGGETGKLKPNVIVLPVSGSVHLHRIRSLLSQEIFNSPYGHVHFPKYAERIGYVPGQQYDITNSESESVRMLSSAAKETGTWLVGGSIPELDDNKVYNTCTVYSPKGIL